MVGWLGVVIGEVGLIGIGKTVAMKRCGVPGVDVGVGFFFFFFWRMSTWMAATKNRTGGGARWQKGVVFLARGGGEATKPKVSHNREKEKREREREKFKTNFR